MLHSDYYAPHLFNTSFSSSFTHSDDSDFSCSCSGEFSASTSMDTLHVLYSSAESLMVHDPYSMVAYKMIPRLTASLVSSNNGLTLDSDEEGTEAECTIEQPKRIRKKKVKCPNGHRSAKRLRYRKGQSHYSCLECQVRWKA